MGALGTFWASTIGKKVVMAVTGLMMIGFVIGHVSGNLLVFRGPDAINHYAALLKSLGGFLWAARITLLVSVVLHFTAAYQLTMAAQAARPADYVMRAPQVSTLASKTMRWGGAFLLFFIVFHLAHFTIGSIDRTTFSETDVYNNMMVAFANPWYVAFYEVAMVFLGLHLFHGAWASVRTLGVSKPSQHPLHRRIATVLAFGVWLAFSVIPVGILAGFAKPADASSLTAATDSTGATVTAARPAGGATP